MHLAFLTSTVNRDDATTVDAPLVTALTARGVTVSFPAWDDPTVDVSDADAVVVRTTWNYQTQRDHFLDVLAHIADITTLINPLTSIRWNTHKQYLADLNDQGAPVIPTVVIPRGTDVALRDLAFAGSYAQLVVKPAVGAGGRAVSVGQLDRLADTFRSLVQQEDVVVQPYMAHVETAGETSLIVAGGTVTHAVTKRPPAGEFRAHERYGAEYRAHTVTSQEAELAVWVTQLLAPVTPVLARIDVIRDMYGTLYVSEVELTEPNLYLTVVPAAAEPLADVLQAQVDEKDTSWQPSPSPAQPD